MNRLDAATFVGLRVSAYLGAAGRAATDTTGSLKEVIDDAFRALGYLEASLTTATTTTATADEDLRVQVMYRALLQVVRDIGATYFDVSVGDSFKLSQVRTAAEKDLALAMAAMIERFGTLGIVPIAGASLVWSIDTNYLDDFRLEVVG